MNNIKLAENTLGQRIKAQRIRMGYTQEKLAELMCVPKPTISSYENDRIDIKGSVKHEGVYELDSNKRVVDAIELAGGATSKADLSVTNLSKKLKDEMVIIIYTKEEVKNFIKVKEEEVLKNTQCISKTPVNNSCIEENVDVDSDKKSKIQLK